MKSIRVLTPILSLTMSCMLLAGCGKHAEQPAENAPGNAPQPASTPAPPPDQPGASSPAPNAAPAPSQNGAPASTPAPNGPGGTAQAAPPALVIPAGTHIAVTTQRDLGSKISQAGETFTATVAEPIEIDGQTAIRAGARVTGTVVDAKPLGRLKGGAYLELRLDAVRADGNTYQIRSNALERVEKGKGRRTAKFAGGGAGLGAILGGVAGGGKGALIGGLLGGGAGAAGAGLSGKRDIFIPAETTLTFRLRNAVQVSPQ